MVPGPFSSDASQGAGQDNVQGAGRLEVKQTADSSQNGAAKKDTDKTVPAPSLANGPAVSADSS